MLRDGNFDTFWTKAANVPWDPKPEFSAKFKDLIWRMIRFDPRDRVTLEEAFNKADDLGWYDDCEEHEIKAYVQSTLEEQERAFQQQQLDELKRLALQFREGKPSQWYAILKQFKDYDNKVNDAPQRELDELEELKRIALQF